MLKARVITVVAFILLMAITLGACTPKVQLPILREAPGFTLINQDGLEVRLSDFRGQACRHGFHLHKLPRYLWVDEPEIVDYTGSIEGGTETGPCLNLSQF